MFFKKEKVEEKLEVRPLNYWEKDSFILVPLQQEENDKDKIIERLERNGIKVKGFAEYGDDVIGRIVFEYENESYEVNYIEDKFILEELYLFQISKFNEEEIENIKKCNRAFVIRMELTDNFKKEYKAQLKIAYSIVDEVYAILDESAEKILHPDYVKDIITSSVDPSVKAFYSVQVVSDNGDIWLHTHGLNRLGITELEILNSKEEIYNFHYETLNTLASFLIEKKETKDNKYFIGYVNEEVPLLVTHLIWNKALEYYKGLDLGGIEDRRGNHNTNTSVIFTYNSDDDYENNILSKLNIHDDAWEDDPVFFVSTEETNRMSKLAIEKFDYIKKYFKEEEQNVLIKIGIKIDNSDNEDDSCEHMWFELLKINDDDTFEAKLDSEPYNVSNLKRGDIGTYSIDMITDWLLFIDDKRYYPDNVYLIK